jgi:hypothetical protein
VIEQADAPARHFFADRLRLVGSVQAEIGVLIASVQIKRARSERIVDAARQAARVMRIDGHSANHVLSRRPPQPFGLSAHDSCLGTKRKRKTRAINLTQRDKKTKAVQIQSANCT